MCAAWYLLGVCLCAGSLPCPVDCLQLLAYKDRLDRVKGLRERSSITLEAICGLEPGLQFEGLTHTLAIVCQPQSVMLGFDSREAMCAWDARIRYALGEGEYHVLQKVKPGGYRVPEYCVCRIPDS